MADEKNAKFTGEKKLPELMDKLDDLLRKEMPGRPYLVTVTTGYEIGKDGDKTTLAAQWSWRSNVIVGKDDALTVSEFLSNQLKEVIEHPEYGIRKTYAKKK